MTDRAELVEAALDVYPDGLALLDLEDRIVYWNRAAELMTGYPGANLVGRPIPGGLLALAQGVNGDSDSAHTARQGSLVHAQHMRGHDLPAITRRVILRDGLGARIGTAAVFRPADLKGVLPHGDTGDGAEVRESQAELEEHLEGDYEVFKKEGLPLGVLWISVDQSQPLRKTHGARGCETMLETVERTLANALRPNEEIGRWGDDDFLVLLHENGEQGLADRAHQLAGLARTTDFQWWGDRVSITVSIGVAQAERDETLAEFLERAQNAMLASMREGGNHVSLAPRRQACSRS